MIACMLLLYEWFIDFLKLHTSVLLRLNSIVVPVQSYTSLLQVGNLKDIYHFVMPKKSFDSETTAKGISELQPLYTVTDALKLELNVSGNVRIYI